MGAKLGSEKLGSLYSGGEVRKRREWRGVKDTLYDYSCWLKTMGVLEKLMTNPDNIKGFLR